MKLFIRTIVILCGAIIVTFQANAQRIAVLEFQPGVGVSLSDVDGLSSIFVTYFSPKGYTLVERSQVDKIIDEQQFQRSSMTERQMVRIGEILNLTEIVVGNINLIRNEYNVDVRIINIESGTIAEAEGCVFGQGSSYRESMKNLAVKLSNKISIDDNQTQPQQSQSDVIPSKLLSKLSRYPKQFSVALQYKERLLFADTSTLSELANYPNANIRVIAIMIEGGEEAFGIGLRNEKSRLFSCSDAYDYKKTENYMLMMSPDEAKKVLQHMEKINDILRMLDSEEMASRYWCNDVEYSYSTKKGTILDLKNSNSPITYYWEYNYKSIPDAFIRPIFRIETLRKLIVM